MNKVISIVRSNNNNIQAGSTILSRYKSLVDSIGGELPYERMYKFLAGENARIMNKCRGDGTLDDQTAEECKLFAAYYVTRVSQEARKNMSKRFGGLPFFLRAGIAKLSEKPPIFPWNTTLNLTNEQLVQTHALIKFVEGLDANRIATVYVKDPENNRESKEAIPLARDMSSDSMKTRRSLFLAYIGYMIQYEGSLLLRLCISESEFVVMGFRAKGGKLHVIPANQLERIYSDPNKPSTAKQNVEFKTAILN